MSAGVTLFTLLRLEPIRCHRVRNVSQGQVFFFNFFAGRELSGSIPVEVNVKIAKTGAVTVRLDPELKGRLAQAATKLDLSENDIVRHALRAAVNAIEANDYKIELPLEMALAKGPTGSRITGPSEAKGKYPRGRRATRLAIRTHRARK
jgi:predicted transcriptional regulator